MLVRTIAVLFALAFVAASPAQQPRTRERLTEQAVVERLASPRRAVRDAAMADLIGGGTTNVALLRRVLEGKPAEAARELAARALAICEVDAPVDNHVKVGLFADRTRVVVGAPLRLTARLCNVGDTPVRVFLGMSCTGNVLENGFALQSVDDRLREGPQARAGMARICATGSQAVVVEVPPYDCVEFTTEAKLRPQPLAPAAAPLPGPHLAMGLTSLVLEPDANGKCGVRLCWASDPRRAEGWVSAPTLRPDWIGNLVSNRVELALQ